MSHQTRSQTSATSNLKAASTASESLVTSISESSRRKTPSTTSSTTSNKRAKKEILTADEKIVLKATSSLVRTIQRAMPDAGLDFGAHLHILDLILTRPLGQLGPTDLNLLKMPVPDIVYPSGKPRDSYWAMWVEELNRQLKLAAVVASKIVDATLVKPSPHSFAQRSVWRDWQQKKESYLPPPIYCGRPPETAAMTISVLHTVFRHFLHNLNAFDAHQENFYKYIEVAHQLCSEMEKKYPNEKARGEVFDACVSPIFEFEKEQDIGAEAQKHGDHVDGLVKHDGVITLIREDKTDLGDGGDSFMQAARAYEILVSDLKGKGVAAITHGAPMFLLTIQDNHRAPHAYVLDAS